MGYRTLDAVWRALRASHLRPADRLVLLALAQAARDDTGRCWPGVQWLTDVTGLTAETVRRVVNGLRAAGWIDREPVAHTVAGGPIYATKGRRAVYVIGHRSLVDNRGKGPHQAVPLTGQSPTSGMAFGSQSPTAETVKPLRGVAPTHTRELHSIDARARRRTTTKTGDAEAIVADRLDCPPDVAAAVVAAITSRHQPRNIAGYVTALADADLAAVAAMAAADADDAQWRAEYHARRESAPLCKHEAPDFLHPQTGLPDCPLCRRATSPSEQEASA